MAFGNQVTTSVPRATSHLVSRVLPDVAHVQALYEAVVDAEQ